MGKEKIFKNNYGRIILIFLSGWLLAASAVMGKTSPLCLSLIGSLCGIESIAAFLGVSIKSLLGGEFTAAVPIIISAAVIAAFKVVIKGNKSKIVVICNSVLCGSAVLLTELITIQHSSELFGDIILAVAGGIGCYTFSVLFDKKKKSFNISSAANIKALPAVITSVFAAASLSSITLGIFNIGIIISAAAVMIAAYRYRFIGGGVVGIICALGLAIALDENQFLGIILAAGGLTAAAAAPKGRIPLAASFIFTSAFICAMLGMDKQMLAFTADIVIGSVIFAALPLNKIRESMKSGFENMGKGGTVSDVLSERFDLIGSTFGELKYAVEKTAETLDGEKGRDISEVYNSACDTVCKNCRFNIKCWGDEYNDSVRTMNKLIGMLKRGEPLSAGSFIGKISERCPKKQQLIESINKKYDDFVYSEQMGRRIKEMRGILTKQLDNTEKLFSSMAKEFDAEIVLDRASSLKVERLLERCGIYEPKAAVKKSDGVLIVEAYGKGSLSCDAEEFGNMLIETLQKEFDLPTVLRYGDKIRITAFERAAYGIKSASCQLSRKKDAANGDSVACFIDGKGYYYGILSDGMGSGTRAKIDSAFVCGLLIKLLECGVEPENAIEFLNTSLMVKSSDESFATLDLCKVDLYTGKTVIYKAGASDSYIKSGNTITKISGKGLPIGISRNISISSHSFTAGESDVIIMTSDGAEISEQWLTQAFSRDSSKNMDELVKTVAGAARFNAEKGREDDISVVALQIKK